MDAARNRLTLVLSSIAWLLSACASQPPAAPSFGVYASMQPEVIERGRYLVRGPAHCTACHGADLSGGTVLKKSLLLGKVAAPNITSDPVAGLGAMSDDALVQSLRYGISRHGRPVLPYMLYFDLTDEDLQAILSYLRTVPPVAGKPAKDGLTPLGRMGIRHLLASQGPVAPPPENIKATRTAEYGAYLANTVAGCKGCHSPRSQSNGAFSGAPYTGGMTFRDGNRTWIAPGLMSGAAGALRGLSEQDFIARFRARDPAQYRSPMPWQAYAQMSDTELGAIYRYLRSLTS